MTFPAKRVRPQDVCFHGRLPFSQGGYATAVPTPVAAVWPSVALG